MELHRFYVYVLKIDSGLHAVSVFCLVFVSLSRDLLFCNSLASIDPSRALSVWTIFVSQKKKNYLEEYQEITWNLPGSELKVHVFMFYCCQREVFSEVWRANRNIGYLI